MHSFCKALVWLKRLVLASKVKVCPCESETVLRLAATASC